MTWQEVIALIGFFVGFFVFAVLFAWVYVGRFIRPEPMQLTDVQRQCADALVDTALCLGYTNQQIIDGELTDDDLERIVWNTLRDDMAERAKPRSDKP